MIPLGNKNPALGGVLEFFGLLGEQVEHLVEAVIGHPGKNGE